eukprot:762328-Pyramimonas_sp.AAC.1
MGSDPRAAAGTLRRARSLGVHLRRKLHFLLGAARAPGATRGRRPDEVDRGRRHHDDHRQHRLGARRGRQQGRTAPLHG